MSTMFSNINMTVFHINLYMTFLWPMGTCWNDWLMFADSLCLFHSCTTKIFKSKKGMFVFTKIFLHINATIPYIF